MGSNKTSYRYIIDIRTLQMNQYIEQNTVQHYQQQEIILSIKYMYQTNESVLKKFCPVKFLQQSVNVEHFEAIRS